MEPLLIRVVEFRSTHCTPCHPPSIRAHPNGVDAFLESEELVRPSVRVWQSHHDAMAFPVVTLLIEPEQRFVGLVPSDLLSMKEHRMRR
jgi:hypothetical protein